MQKSKVEKSILYLVGILSIVILWDIVAEVKDNTYIYPTLDLIATRLLEIVSTKAGIYILFLDVVRILISVSVSFVIGLALTILYIKFPASFSFFKIYLEYFKSVPIIVLSIFIWLIVPGKIAPGIITCFVAIPVVTYGLISAVDQMDKVLLDDLKMLEVNFIKKLIYVYIPYLSPYFIMIFLQSFGLAFKVMITSEYICQTQNSIGQVLYDAKSNLDMDVLIAWSIVIVVIVVIIELLFRYVNKKMYYEK